MSKLDVLLLERAEIESIRRDLIFVWTGCGSVIEVREAMYRIDANFTEQLKALEPRIDAEREAEAYKHPTTVTVHKVKHLDFYDCPNCKRSVVRVRHLQCPACWSDIEWVELRK